MAKWRGYGGVTEHWDSALDAQILIAGLAEATKRVQVWTTVHTLLQNPAVTAKMLATLDQISNGRAGLNVVTGAYKDEFEVARLHTDPAFLAQLDAQFKNGYTVKYNLAPPLLAERDPQTGHLQKKEFGPWMFKAFKFLAGFKKYRGSALDVFGKTEERRTERALIGEYRACVEELLRGLNAGNLAAAVEIARLPEDIRGYGHVKARHLAAVRPKWERLMAQWRAGGARAAA
mgnify:CR=1 FL=1